MTFARQRRRGGMLALLTAGTLLLSACMAATPPAEPAATPSTPPAAEGPESPAPTSPMAQYRELGEPIADWTCDDLVPRLRGETSRTEQQADARLAGIEGEISCRLRMALDGDAPDAGALFTLVVADLGDEAESAVRAIECCFGGKLIPGSDPLQRDECTVGYCAGSIAANGFVANVWSSGVAEDHRIDHENVMASIAALLTSAERPDPLGPSTVGVAPLESCDSAPQQLASAVGEALGGSTAAVARVEDSGDALWLWYYIAGRRGTVACGWSLEDGDGWTESLAYVTVTPGAQDLLGAPGMPFVDSDDPDLGLRYSFAAGSSVVTVDGVDRATAEAIAVAHG